MLIDCRWTYLLAKDHLNVFQLLADVIIHSILPRYVVEEQNLLALNGIYLLDSISADVMRMIHYFI